MRGLAVLGRVAVCSLTICHLKMFVSSVKWTRDTALWTLHWRHLLGSFILPLFKYLLWRWFTKKFSIRHTSMLRIYRCIGRIDQHTAYVKVASQTYDLCFTTYLILFIVSYSSLIWSADQETLTYFLRGVFRPVYPKLPRCRGPSTVKLCWELSVALFRPVSAASREMMDSSKLAHRGKTWPVPSTWWSLQVINKHNTHSYTTLTTHTQYMLVSNTPCFEMLAYQTTNFSLGNTLLLLLHVMKMTSSTKRMGI